MCKVDFDWELGEASGGNKVYASRQDLLKHRKCTTDPYHSPVEVVTLSKEDFDVLWATSTIAEEELYQSNIGPIIWSKEK